MRDSGRDGWTSMAIVSLAVVGVLLVVPGALLVVIGSIGRVCALACGGELVLALLGVIIGGVGLAHLAAARAYRRRHPRARALALVAVLPVILLLAAGMVVELAARQFPSSGLIALPWLAMLFVVWRTRPA